MTFRPKVLHTLSSASTFRGSPLARTLGQKGKGVRHDEVHVKSVNIQNVRQQPSALQKGARNEQLREGTDKAAKTWAKRLRMNKDNEYRENAAECERMARLTRDKADKRSWLDMAQHWRSLISVPPGGSQQPGD